ncbi:hypothetical protein [Desulforhabdus amnigena]|jgi:hypothetical protein|uniref:hypothetical protein n=1 Tax=Desulforhabdus amnigena TaxID=40218 RepID=UPI00169B1017|nr:hypothetical protein [Desulforhabdus amnigena]NLJ26640.1 hypothetical protein [Deltaproteobacteria bacterium]
MPQEYSRVGDNLSAPKELKSSDEERECSVLEERKSKNVPPLKASPLRLPGQSIQEEIDKIFHKVTEIAILLGIVTVMSLLEWMRYFHNSPPQPVLFSFIALASWSYGIWKVVKIKRKVWNLKQPARPANR